MREIGDDAASAEGDWLDWLDRQRHPRRSPASTPARWSGTSATKARCAAGSSRPRSSDAERRLERSRPSRRWRAPTSPSEVTPREPIELRRAMVRTSSRSTPASRSIIANAASSAAAADAAPVRHRRRAMLARDPGPLLPRQRPGRPGGARRRGREGPRAGRQAADVRHLPRPPAALPRGRPRDLQASVRPPRREPPGQGSRDRHHRHHLAEPRLRGRRPGGSGTIDVDEPLRWDTDFGAAELSHINLYDRTVEGLRAPGRERR